jgi:Ca2+-binding RTX toxin-like protein
MRAHARFLLTLLIAAPLALGFAGPALAALVIHPKTIELAAGDTRDIALWDCPVDAGGAPIVGADGIPGTADDDCTPVAASWFVSGPIGTVFPPLGATTTLTAALPPGATSATGAVIAAAGGRTVPASVLVTAPPIRTATSTRLLTSPNPSDAGQPVTFLAIVAGDGGAPTGTVTFRRGTAVLGTSPLDIIGRAFLGVSTLDPGTHPITATYNGDAAFLPSTSDVVTQTVRALTTTGIGSSPNPSTFRQDVVLTSDVTSPGAGIPTGEVVFVRNATETLGTAALDDAGRATLTTAALTVGTHRIAAVYAGDAGHVGSTSPSVEQTVEQALPGSAVLVPDATDPTLTELLVVGTAGDDVIRVIRESGNGRDGVQVIVNGVDLGTFEPTGRIVVRGLEGDDEIVIGGIIPRRSWVYGDAGNDTITTRFGNAALFGGDGDDRMLAGGGRDLLIGGNGADALLGQNGDDILIAGSTSFDSATAAIASILAEWGSGRSYAERTASIAGTASGGANGSVVLVPGTTVRDDAAVDTLTGGHARDFFYGFFGDVGDARDHELVLGPVG